MNNFNMKKISFSVSGMHCESCELLIKDELSQLKGLSDITIDHKTGKGLVTVEDEKITHSDILGAITKAGYKATINETNNSNLEKDSIEIIKKTIKQNEPLRVIFEIKVENPETQKEDILTLQKNENSQKRVSLSLSGMHCSSCALIIEKSLKKVPGVKDANVNFSAEKALITYDESAVKKDSFIDAVKNAGYSSTFIDDKDPSFEANKRKKEIGALFSKFMVSLVLSIPLIYFMLFDFFSWIPGRVFFLPLVGIISLILTTPVQFIIGKGFYKGAWSALRMKDR